MKIGKFAEKHGVTQDTVRFYLEKGLLVSKKKGGQYSFTEADSRDLEKIIELKQLDFSIAEIERILVIQRISGSSTDVFRNLYLPFLETKKKEVLSELNKYNNMKEYLDERIQEIRVQDLKKGQSLGFPMSSLGLLVCPLCKRALNISAGIIEKSSIMDAIIDCECGFRAKIENGVYIDGKAVRTKLLNNKKMPTKEEYLEECSHSYVNFLYQGMATMIEYINQNSKSPKYIMELDNCVGFFLLQYIKYLPRNTTYILIEYDRERLDKLKRNLEMYYEHTSFIFLCCDYHMLPIADSSIDIIVDHGMTKVYMEEKGEFLPEVLKDLLKEEGGYIAAHQYSNDVDKGLKPLRGAKDILARENFLNEFTESGFRTIDTVDIGPVYETDEKKQKPSIEQFKLISKASKQ